MKCFFIIMAIINGQSTELARICLDGKQPELVLIEQELDASKKLKKIWKEILSRDSLIFNFEKFEKKNNTYFSMSKEVTVNDEEYIMAIVDILEYEHEYNVYLLENE